MTIAVCRHDIVPSENSEVVPCDQVKLKIHFIAATTTAGGFTHGDCIFRHEIKLTIKILYEFSGDTLSLQLLRLMRLFVDRPTVLCKTIAVLNFTQ